MSPEAAAGSIQRGLLVALMVAGPLLIFGLVAGLLIGILQAVTQVQEMTLTFIPKIVAIVAAMFIFGQWMMLTLIRFSREIFDLLAKAAG